MRISIWNLVSIVAARHQGGTGDNGQKIFGLLTDNGRHRKKAVGVALREYGFEVRENKGDYYISDHSQFFNQSGPTGSERDHNKG